MLSLRQKQDISVLTLPQALKAAVSGASKSATMADIAEKYGFNYATFANCLNPTTPSHTPNIHHLQAVLVETKDARILDSLHALHGNSAWFELPDVEIDSVHFLQKIGSLGNEMGRLAQSVCAAIEDDRIELDEHDVIQKDVFKLIRVAAEILAMTKIAAGKS